MGPKSAFCDLAAQYNRFLSPSKPGCWENGRCKSGTGQLKTQKILFLRREHAAKYSEIVLLGGVFVASNSTFWGGRLRKMFCSMFSESSTGSWAELQLPCCPSKQGELPENMLQNLLHNLQLPPQTVSLF